MTLRKVLMWSLIVLALAVGYLFYEPPTPVRSQVPGPVNLTGEVEASQCYPCHLRIAEAKKPGLIFNHGIHLTYACSACHYSMPHHDGQTDIPPMQACFNCHGISHGPQGEMARRDCWACHTSKWNLRPADHTKDFAGKPHADVAKQQGVNDCLMCHDSVKDCDTCHLQKKVMVAGRPIGAMQKTYIPMAPVLRPKPKVVIDMGGKTTMSQCIYCHPNLDAFDKSRVIFAHDVHLRRDYECSACHPTFPHTNDSIARPPMQTCYQCHGLEHNGSGLVATEDCGKCHPKSFQLKPANHTAAFVAGDHKKMAGADVAYCTMCHKDAFCIDCHQGRKQLPDGTYSKVVIPVNHRRADWSSKHGPQFLQQKGTCGACHDSPSCQTCHYTPMPHPTDWLSSHGKTAGALDPSKRDCDVCHTDRERCQACHHAATKGQALTLDACGKGPGLHGCHVEMTQEPPTSIKDKKFAEHAVHFEVAKYKGKPYKCYECHVGFGTGSNSDGSSGSGSSSGQTSGSGTNLASAGHDLRLCYSCHGASDAFNQKIAPYPGAELCRRCHTDLKI